MFWEFKKKQNRPKKKPINTSPHVLAQFFVSLKPYISVIVCKKRFKFEQLINDFPSSFVETPLLYPFTLTYLFLCRLQLNASDDRGIGIVRGQILSFASTRTIFRYAKNNVVRPPSKLPMHGTKRLGFQLCEIAKNCDRKLKF